MTAYRYMIVFAATVFLGGMALAQAKELFTGQVISTDGSDALLIVQLDEQNSCGSNTYVASTSEMIAITEAAINEAAGFDGGVLTLKTQGCASGSAVIIGAAGGPDLRDEF